MNPLQRMSVKDLGIAVSNIAGPILRNVSALGKNANLYSQSHRIQNTKTPGTVPSDEGVGYHALERSRIYYGTNKVHVHRRAQERQTALGPHDPAPRACAPRVR